MFSYSYCCVGVRALAYGFSNNTTCKQLDLKVNALVSCIYFNLYIFAIFSAISKSRSYGPTALCKFPFW